MRNCAKYVCSLVLSGSIGLVAIPAVDARDRDMGGRNSQSVNEKREELIAKIQKLEDDKKRRERLRLLREQRILIEKRLKNVKMVDAAEVWHNCNIEVKAIDGKLDKAYIERQFQSYLSGIASMIKKEEKTGHYVIEGTVDAAGKIIDLEVTQDSFKSSTLKEQISTLLARLNYGKSFDGNEAKITLMIVRDEK